ncbi:MAG: riboflavin synthase, partial [Candidatus Eisenbacteria bacterium]|nr:riboflavin synthase [Candidatus Eisenbacteria bacterium]
MFTGLVEAIGRIARAGSREGVRELVIRSPFAPGELPAGSSVAVQGVCLTLLEDAGSDGSFRVQAAAETLRRTTLGRLRAADRVHLERAVRPMDRMGGHFVQGHVDGIGVLRRVARLRGDWVLEVEAPPSIRRYIVEKGSICVDGVSLTVGAVGPRWFRVHIIP